MHRQQHTASPAPASDNKTKPVAFLYRMKAKIILLIALWLLPALTMAQHNDADKKPKSGKEKRAAKNKIPDSVQTALNNLDEVFGYIYNLYVDSPNMTKESEAAINAMLKALDPHSAFIPARDVEKVNEPLQGKFSGVGISFRIRKDTIVVEDLIEGGSCAAAGMMRGDKIVQIDGKNSTGDSVNQDFVRRHLRGKKGSHVLLTVQRIGSAQPLTFDIVRKDVPMASVSDCFMLTDTIGYLRLTRFARTSHKEVIDSMKQLEKEGATAIVFDLRGNTGGFLDIAFRIAGEFLPAHRLIVYTEGRKSPRQDLISHRKGRFAKGDLVVLIDEGSASASEIVSGAMQDWDRATLIGRRTFGKGLVQRLYYTKDGSQLRLTTARYYTPSGRCIQKPYDEGEKEYRNDIANRYKHGELTHKDSIHFADSLKYRTSKGRIIYGGGGIMPDIFVPLDTAKLSPLFQQIRTKGLLDQFAAEFADSKRLEWQNRSTNDFLLAYPTWSVDSLFANYLLNKGIEHRPDNDTIAMRITATGDTIRCYADDDRSRNYMTDQLKATIVSNLYGSKQYYPLMLHYDQPIQTALRHLQGKKEE